MNNRETTTLTCYFESRQAADRYYRDYGYTDASEQLNNGSIHLGPPEIAPGERLTVNSEGRYQIHSPDKVVQPVLTIEQELAMLSLAYDVIKLPSAQLAHYVEIKRRIELAGGKYRKTMTGFTFKKGVDVEATFNLLLSGKIERVQQKTQAFYTPLDEAHALCRKLGDLAGMDVLEPSAGDGVLADVTEAAGARVLTVENYQPSAMVLRDKGYEVIEQDFLTVTPRETGLVDAVIANPPYTRDMDIRHVMHMWQFLKPGGQLAVIMSTAWRSGSKAVHRNFRAFLEQHQAEIEEIPAGTFKESGTSVATTRVYVRKPLAAVEVVKTDRHAVSSSSPSEQFGFAF